MPINIQTLAHVGYVIPQEEQAAYEGADTAFLLSGLRDYQALFTVLLISMIGIGIYRFLNRRADVKKYIEAVKKRGAEYHALIPWILRLSLGIALIGAGAGGVIISPIFADGAAWGFLQIILGFLLLLGLTLAPVTALVIVLFLIALFKNAYLIGNIDFLGSAVALGILANGKPGLDDLLGLRFPLAFAALKPYVPLILRIGIGGAMIFLAVQEKLLNPHLSALVVAEFKLQSVIPVSPALWVLGTGAIECLVGILLVIGFKTRLISAITFAILTLSFFFFGEDVYSHITLFGILSVLFVTGAGKMSVDKGVPHLKYDVSID